MWHRWLVGCNTVDAWMAEPPPSILQVWLGTSDDWIGSSDRPTKEQGNPPVVASDDQKIFVWETHGILESQRKQKLFFYLLFTFIFFKGKMSSLFLFFSYSLGGNEVRLFLVVVAVAFSGRFFVMCLLFKATFNLTESFSAAVCSCVATSTFAWGCPSGDYC